MTGRDDRLICEVSAKHSSGGNDLVDLHREGVGHLIDLKLLGRVDL